MLRKAKAVPGCFGELRESVRDRRERRRNGESRRWGKKGCPIGWGMAEDRQGL